MNLVCYTRSYAFPYGDCEIKFQSVTNIVDVNSIPHEFFHSFLWSSCDNPLGQHPKSSSKQLVFS